MSSVSSLPRATTAEPSTQSASPCARGAEPWILATTILASSMAFIDGTVVNVALPALQRSLGATLESDQWIVEAYVLMLSALLLVGGATGDRFGRRRVFILGLSVFTAASVICGLSSSVTMLTVARGIQGIGGALLIPGSLALLSASFPAERRGRAIGTWSGFTAMTTAFGPVLGGFLIDHASWRFAFFMNVPLAAAAGVLTFRFVPESRNDFSPKAVDWMGSVLAAIALGGIVYALIESQSAGWSDRWVIGALAAGLVMLPAFVLFELRHPAPILPPALFRSSDFAGANLLTLLLYAALRGSLFFVPMNLIQVQGYSAAEAGAALLPFVLLMFLLSRWAGGLVDRHGAKLPLVIGPMIAACGFALYVVPAVGGSYWLTFFPAAIVLGFGMTVTVAPLTTTVMGSVAPGAVGTASGINNAVASVAGLLAIAGLGMVMSNTFDTQLRRGLAEANVSRTIVEAVGAQRAKLAAIEPPASASAGSRLAIHGAVDAAFVSGFRRVMWIATALALASAVSAWAMIGARRLRPAAWQRLLLLFALAMTMSSRSPARSPAGDWTQFGWDVAASSAPTDATGITASNLSSLRRRQVPLDGTVDASAIYLHAVGVNGSDHDVFFVTTSYGKTIAIDADRGSVLWEFTPANYASWAGTRQITNSTPAADPDRLHIYAASPDGRIQKLAISDGHAVWTTAVTLLPSREKIASPLREFRGRIIAVTGGYIGDAPPYQGHVAILDAQSGKLLQVWNSLCSDHAGLLVPSSCRSTQSAIWGRAGAVIDPATGNIFVATGNGPYNGKTDWGDAVIELNADATRILGNYTPSDNFELDVRDLDLGSTSPVLLGAGLLAQGGKDRLIRLLGIDAIAGPTAHEDHELESLPTPSGDRLFTAPAVWRHGGETWVFAADSGAVAAWTLEGGRLVSMWRSSNGGTSPVIAGDLLYVYDPRGGLRVYEPTKGTPLATLESGTGHWNSPIVVDGRIALPEGNADQRATSGVLDIWSLPQ